MEFEKEGDRTMVATTDPNRQRRHHGYDDEWDDALVGQKVTTEFGNGVVSHVKAFDGLLYCCIKLDTSGTITLLRDQVDELRVVEVQKAHTSEPDSLEPEYEPTRRRSGSRRKEYAYTPFLKKKMELPKHTKSGRVPNIMGHIRMYNPTKGWGFVVCSDYEGDVFLHSKHILGNPPPEYIGHFNSCAKGHSVKFDLDVHDNDRPQALNVRMIGGALSKKDDSQKNMGFKAKAPSIAMAPNPQFNSYMASAQNYNGDKGESVKSHSGAASIDSQWERDWERPSDQWGGNGKLLERDHHLQDAQQLETMNEQPGDWYCPNPQCRDLQFARNLRCRVCGTPKPSNGRAQNQMAPPKGKGRPETVMPATDNYVSNGYQTYTQPYPQARPVNGYPQGYAYPLQSGPPVHAPQYTHPLAQSHTSAAHMPPSTSPPMQQHAPHPMVQGFGSYGPNASLPQYNVAYHQYVTQSQYQPSHPMQSHYGTSAYDSPRPQVAYEADYQSVASPYLYGATPHTSPSFEYGPPLSSVQMTPPSPQPPSYMKYDRI